MIALIVTHESRSCRMDERSGRPIIPIRLIQINPGIFQSILIDYGYTMTYNTP